MRKPVVLLLTAFLLTGAVLTADTSGTPPSPTPSVSTRVGLFWEQPLELPVNSDLSAAGLATLDPHGLWSFGAASGFTLGPVRWEIASRRFSNTWFTTPSGDHRTRLLGDITDLIGGGSWNLGDHFTLNAGLGVNVTKFQLQTYGAGAGTWSEALAQTQQVSLVSSWNWGTLATARLGWRPFGTDKTNMVLALGLTVAWSPFSASWKLNDDRAISGLSTPWNLSWTPALWFGIE